MRTHKIFVLILFFALLATTCTAQGFNPLKGISILLDPGHGGRDSGAVGPTGLKESDINLRVARYLKILLQADGAKVSMTRNTDKYVSLGARVQMAKKIKPDLFVSIHHNAALKKVTRNVSEVYYNAMDQGLPRIIGKEMTKELLNKGFGKESMIIPGGFFVLRNNTAPAILTEGSYMTIPHIEQQLKSGKMLTDEAQALREAIKEAFSKGALKIKLLTADKLSKINTPFFNFLFTSNKPIKKISVRNLPKGLTDLSFKRLPSLGNIYSLYNEQPLKSGKYEIQITFYSTDGIAAPVVYLNLEVSLPLANSTISSVIPYIPRGFKGKIPITITLKDTAGNDNSGKSNLFLLYRDKKIPIENPDKSGVVSALLELNGNERHSIEVKLFHNSRYISKLVLKIREPSQTFVLGKLVSTDNKPISNAKISYGLRHVCKTGKNGYFYFTYPAIYNNINISIDPPFGYNPTSRWIRTSGEPVVLPLVKLEPVSRYVMNKTFAVIAPRSFDNLVRKFVRELMNAGAKIIRCNLPENMNHPEYQAVLEANLHKKVDMVISFKRGLGGIITLHHYHRGGRGKRFADAVAFSLKSGSVPIPVKVEAGSDYEINHTGATGVVIIFPQQLPPDYPIKVVMHILAVLKSGF